LTALWDIAPHSLISIARGANCYIIWKIYRPDDGGSMPLWNVDILWVYMPESCHLHLIYFLIFYFKGTILIAATILLSVLNWGSWCGRLFITVEDELWFELDKKKFWQELICLLSLHKLTVNNLVTMVTMQHKQSKPTADQGSPNKVEHQ
jgi:hypothetical protein